MTRRCRPHPSLPKVRPLLRLPPKTLCPPSLRSSRNPWKVEEAGAEEGVDEEDEDEEETDEESKDDDVVVESEVEEDVGEEGGREGDLLPPETLAPTSPLTSQEEDRLLTGNEEEGRGGRRIPFGRRPSRCNLDHRYGRPDLIVSTSPEEIAIVASPTTASICIRICICIRSRNLSFFKRS